MLYGAIAAATAAWWMRRERWDAVGVLAGVLVGLLWPFAIINAAIRVLDPVIERIASRAFRR